MRERARSCTAPRPLDYLVFLALVPVAVGLLLWVGSWAWPHRDVPEARALLGLFGVSLGWLVFNAAEVVVPTASATYRLAQAAYVFAIAGAPVWFVFACTFANRSPWFRTPAFAALVAFEVLTLLLVLTNEAHGWMWRRVEFLPVHGMLAIRTTYGPWFYAYLVVGWSLTVVGGWLIVREYLNAARSAKRMSRLVAAGAVLPLLLNVLHVGQVLPVRKDFTPIGMALSGVLMGVGMWRYGLFTYRPVARDVLVEHMGEAMVALDADGTVLDHNDAFRRIFGVSGTGLGQAISDVLPPDVHGALDAALATSGDLALGTGAAARHYAVRVSRLEQRGGRTGDRLVLLHDITERRAAEVALERANHDLRDRNDDLDAFARTVAHDLKNPLHAIHGFAEILRLDGADATDDTREECLDTILALSARMSGIIDDLLRLSNAGRTAGGTEPIDMPAVVTRALDRLAVEIDRRGATVDGARLGDVAAWPVAHGDAGWVEEVWTNYIGNALKYGGEAPHVTLGAERRRDGAVRFFVRDRGPGIPPEAQADLFRPFVRLAGAAGTEGTGLGLSIVARIAERLGGAAGVESTGVDGEGATFWIDLPAASAG